MTLDLRATLARIREAAGKATPGPWHWKEELRHDDMPRLLSPSGRVCDFGNSTQYYPSEGEPPSDEDAAHISTCDPTTMLALCAEVEAVMGENERLRLALGRASNALRTVGDDYPGSSCHDWCHRAADDADTALLALTTPPAPEVRP
jgi:hypothetical protein